MRRQLRNATLVLAVLFLAFTQSIAADDDSGFSPLFNGVDLTGWTGDTKGYWMEDNILVAEPTDIRVKPLDINR